MRLLYPVGMTICAVIAVGITLLRGKVSVFTFTGWVGIAVMYSWSWELLR